MPWTKKTIGPLALTAADVTIYTVTAPAVAARITQIHFASNAAIGSTSNVQASKGAIATGSVIAPTTAVCQGGGVADYYGAPTGYMFALGDTLHVKGATDTAVTVNYEEQTPG